MVPRLRTALVVGGVALLLLPGCGGDEARRAAPSLPTSTATSTPTSTPTSTASGPRPSTPSTLPFVDPDSTRTPPPSAAASRAPTVAPAPPPAPTPAPAPPCAGVDREVLPTQDRVVALTVDLGGDAAGLPAILSTLSDQRVPATFFVTGAWVRRYPDGLQRVAAAGHPVGNHTDTHPALTASDDAAIRAQLAAVEELVVARTGRTTRPLFRFPFGDRDARTIAVVNGEGYCAYRWTVDTLGWKGTSGGITAQVVVDRVLAALRPGEIVLMHGGAHPDDRSTLDADALPDVISRLRERGYTFTTLPR
jgi:peptidoglycan-N-acetylglucosamine deacetylase